MTDFLSAFNHHLRQTQADRIAGEVVTALCPDMEGWERARYALQAIRDGFRTLQMVVDADDVMLNAEQVAQLEEIESILALLKPRVKLRRSMLALAGMFGRPL